MRIIATASECSSRGDWDAFCAITGTDFYAMAEGMDGETEFSFTPAEAARIGLIPKLPQSDDDRDRW